MLSTTLVTSTRRNQSRNMKRADLQVGDLFKNRLSGRTYMHTGVRTRPPSGAGDVDVVVDGSIIYSSPDKATGHTFNGKDVIAWQGMVVAGSITSGEDGSVMTTNGDKSVIYVGKAEITLNLFN